VDHSPVLLAQVLEALDLRPGARVLDGTVGYGGHADAILERTAPDGVLVGIDRDGRALEAARVRLARFGERAKLARGRFGELFALEREPFDGILLDLGVSSPQLDTADRGFSFQHDGPVDMRMDPDQPLDARSYLDRVELDELTRVLGQLGEEPRARRIAKAILEGRPWTSTAALADCVARASGYPRGRTHPATRTFQALRMVVNDELGELRKALDAGPELLAEGGRMAVISFQSLEDRMVKDTFRRLAGEGAEKDAYGHPVATPRFALVGRKSIAGKDADAGNPRARSARLRILERTSSRDTRGQR
jgi:16S rRNA (cytosine1402-N4)-methyltransferase